VVQESISGAVANLHTRRILWRELLISASYTTKRNQQYCNTTNTIQQFSHEPKMSGRAVKTMIQLLTGFKMILKIVNEEQLPECISNHLLF